MDEMLELVVGATNQKRTSLYDENWKVVNNIESMAWIDLYLRAELDKQYFRPVVELFCTCVCSIR